MSILQFMEMSVSEAILCSCLAIVVCICYSGIGAFFTPKRGVIFQSVIGMTLIGAIGVICAELFAGGYKYVIVAAAVIGFIALCYRIFKKEIFIHDILKDLIPVLLIFGVLFVELMKLITVENGIYSFNCHQTYFSGVALEILQADYFSRIRLMDVYPFEWSKYHFFNGSYIAIPLIWFFKHNYVTYLMAKMISICFYAGALFNVSASKYGRKKAGLILSLGLCAFWICANNGFVWSLATNNYSCIFMLLLAWLMFEEEDFSAAAILSIGYAITKSGSTISGSLLFLFATWKMFNAERYSTLNVLQVKIREILYSFIIGCGVLSMAFCGTDASGQGSIIFGSVGEVFTNMFNGGWFSVMPLGGAMTNSPPNPLKYEFFFIVVIGYLLFRNYRNIYNTLITYKKTSVFVGVMCILFLFGSYYYVRHISFIIKGFLVWYFLPLLTLLALVEKEMLETFVIFIVSLVINFLLFNAGVTVPNYCIVIFVILMIFARQLVFDLTEKIPKYRNLLYLIIGGGFIYFTAGTGNFENMFFFNPNDTYHEVLKLETIEYTDIPYEYNGENDANSARLNAIKGNRVHYNIMPNASDPIMSRVSMAMRFLPRGYQERFEP